MSHRMQEEYRNAEYGGPMTEEAPFPLLGVLGSVTAYISPFPATGRLLLTLHTTIRNGATDNIIAYLSNGDVLRLKNVAALHWEGALCTKRSDPWR